MKKHKAAISIFLVVITIASVMLGGLFIDLTRILVAKNKVRTATDAALRSTLAGYSDDLVTEWGLFGLLENGAEDNFKKYLRLNLTTTGSGGGANIISYEIIDDETSLTLSKPLSDTQVFSDKITEYEKFRAPVSLTMGTINKFKAIFGSGNEAGLRADSYDISAAIDNLTTKLSNTFSNLSSIKTSLSESVSDAGVETDVSSDSNSLGTIDTSGFSSLQESIDSDFEDAKKKVSDYSDSLDEYEAAGDEVNTITEDIKQNVDTSGVNGDITEDESLIIDENISTYNEDFEKDDDNYDTEIIDKESQLLADTKEETSNVSDKIDSLQAETDALIADAEAKAEEYNRLAQLYNEAYSKLQSLVNAAAAECVDSLTAAMVLQYDTQAKINAAAADIYQKQTSLAEKNSELNEAQTKADDILTEYNNAGKLSEDELRAVIETTDSNVKTSYQYLIAYYSEYYAISIHEGNSLKGEFLKSFYDEEYSKAVKAVSDKENEITILKAEINGGAYLAKKIAAENEALVLQAAEYKKQAVDYYNNTYKPALDKISDVNIQEQSGAGSITDYSASALNISGASDENDSFSMSEILNLEDKIKDYLTELNKEMPKASDASESDLDEDSSIISVFGKLRDYFVSMGEVITDPDKIMDKIYLTDYIMSRCTFVTSQTSRSHYYKWGEVEYIIFGQKTQWLNIAAAVGSITFMRFAINTINYFITSADGELISRTAVAVLRGVGQTASDMLTMLIDSGSGEDEASKKGLIAICPSLKDYKVLSYSDHLRILLLLKMSDDGGAEALRRCIHATLKEKGNDSIPSISETENCLGDYYTQAKAQVSVDVDLFFIPMFMPEAINFGTIHDGKYKVSTSIEYGY